MRTYAFTWTNTKKYDPHIPMTSIVKSDDAESAMGVFIRNNGNLKKTNVLKIQEIDENGEPIGEPIVEFTDEQAAAAYAKQLMEGGELNPLLKDAMHKVLAAPKEI